MSPRTSVELFHLLFLRVLTSGADRANYRVKGGCNLRFWFRSVRYSENLDLEGVKLAYAEKALFDVLYLSATRQRLFRSLPELEIPRGFDRRALDAWTAKITSATLAKVVRRRLAEALRHR